VRKSVVVAAAISVPLVAIAVREAVRLVAGLSDPRQAGAAPILWIFGVFVTLTLIWIGVLLAGRAKERDPARLSLEAAAAIAIAQAKKRPPAARCPRCGRPRVIESAAKCLYCGLVFEGETPAGTR
jgi:cytochrome c-type biogenesis protein CcmH/NrfF